MRVLVILVLGSVLAGLVGYHFEWFGGDSKVKTGQTQVKVNPEEDDTIKQSDPLYKAHEPTVPEVVEDAPVKERAPIVIPGRFEASRQYEASSSLEGPILFIGEEIPLGALHAAGVAPFLPDPCDLVKVKFVESKVFRRFNNADIDKDVEFLDRELVKVYRRVLKGHTVQAGQVLAVLDPAHAISDLSGKRTKWESAVAKHRAADATAEESRANWYRARDLKERKAISEYEYSVAFLTYIRANEEAIGEKVGVRSAQIEMEQSMLILNLHTIENRILASRSMIGDILKHPGDFTKPSEPILKLHSIDRLLAEGLLEDNARGHVQVGRYATIEPSVDEAPKWTKRFHVKEITSVAVTSDGKVVSASEDRKVFVYDPRTDAIQRAFSHKEPVRIVACSPKDAGHNLILAGCADGKVFAWDLSKKTNELFAKVPLDAHADPITALAFSPDGRYFATGSSDFNIKVFSIDAKSRKIKELYTLEPKTGAANTHTGPITSLHFTPQCKLVSAGRDNTLRVWELREAGVVPDGEPIDSRTGNIGKLGVSSDGRYLLFDQGKTLQVLTLKDRLPVNTIQNPGGAIPFDTLALYSPNNSLILTAGAPEGRLQLWTAPTRGERAFEVRQFVTDERAAVTCAAFSPNGDFAVSGNASGQIYIWPVPTGAEVGNHRIRNVRITAVGSTLDANRQARVAIEVPNQFSDQFPAGRLVVGRPLTIVIESNEQKP